MFFIVHVLRTSSITSRSCDASKHTDFSDDRVSRPPLFIASKQQPRPNATGPCVAKEFFGSSLFNTAGTNFQLSDTEPMHDVDSEYEKPDETGMARCTTRQNPRIKQS